MVEKKDRGRHGRGMKGEFSFLDTIGEMCSRQSRLETSELVNPNVFDFLCSIRLHLKCERSEVLKWEAGLGLDLLWSGVMRSDSVIVCITKGAGQSCGVLVTMPLCVREAEEEKCEA